MLRRPGHSSEVSVIKDDKTQNVFALPGGKIAVYTIFSGQRMEQMSQGHPPQFLSTHPSHGTRIAQIEEWMPEAMSHYNPQPGTTAADLPPLSASH